MALDTGPTKDCNYLVNRLEHSSDKMCKGFVKKLVDEGRQAKRDIYEDSKKMVIN